MATIDRQVGASSDDCRMWWTGALWEINLTASSLGAGYHRADAQKRGCGMRFTNITIPKGSTIVSAYLTFTANDNYAVTVVNTKIRGDDADDAPTFSDATDYFARARTTAEVLWDAIAAWTAESEYNSPDIKTVIQEIIDRAGWSSGNAIVIFWDDHDDRSTHSDGATRAGKSYDYDTGECPKLHIEYTEPAAGGARSHGYIIG